jgi:curved DNA-binding protein
MRLTGHGLPRMKGAGKGDQYVVILVDMPKKLSEEQKRLVVKLSGTGL